LPAKAMDEGQGNDDDDDEKTLLTLGRRTAAQRPRRVVAAMASLRSNMDACGSPSLCLSLSLPAWRGASSHNRKGVTGRGACLTLMVGCGERATTGKLRLVRGEAER
jgi:hypothetical protein